MLFPFELFFTTSTLPANGRVLDSNEAERQPCSRIVMAMSFLIFVVVVIQVEAEEVINLQGGGFSLQPFHVPSRHFQS